MATPIASLSVRTLSWDMNPRGVGRPKRISQKTQRVPALRGEFTGHGKPPAFAPLAAKVNSFVPRHEYSAPSTVRVCGSNWIW